jgi:hypothetical protein
MPVIVPKPYKQMQADYAAECLRLAELVFAGYCKDLYTPLYLVGRKQAGPDTLNPRLPIWAALDVRPEAPDGWEIVHGEPLPRGRTVEHTASDFAALLGREPLWIFAD